MVSISGDTTGTANTTTNLDATGDLDATLFGNPAAGTWSMLLGTKPTGIGNTPVRLESGSQRFLPSCRRGV